MASPSVTDALSAAEAAIWAQIDLMVFSRTSSKEWDAKKVKYRIFSYLLNAMKRVIKTYSEKEPCWTEVMVAVVRESVRSYYNACSSRAFFNDVDLTSPILAGIKEILPVLTTAVQPPTPVLCRAISDRVARVKEEYELSACIWHAIMLTFPFEHAKRRRHFYDVLWQAFKETESLLSDDECGLSADAAVSFFVEGWVLRSREREPLLETDLQPLFNRMVALSHGMPRKSRRCVPKQYISLSQDWKQMIACSIFGNGKRIPVYLKEDVPEFHFRDGHNDPPIDSLSCKRKNLFIARERSPDLTRRTRPRRSSSEDHAYDSDSSSHCGIGCRRYNSRSSSVPRQLATKSDELSSSLVPVVSTGLAENTTWLPEISGAVSSHGHVRCSSAQCIGSSTDRLVRRYLWGGYLEMYCLSCWQSIIHKSMRGNSSDLWHGIPVYEHP